MTTHPASKTTKNSRELFETFRFFDDVEELVGTYPSADALRNAIFSLKYYELVKRGGCAGGKGGIVFRLNLVPSVLEGTESLAREYESFRGIHMHIYGDYDMESTGPSADALSRLGKKLPEGVMTIEKKISAIFTACNADCNRPDGI